MRMASKKEVNVDVSHSVLGSCFFPCHLWITFKTTRKKHQHKVTVKHLETPQQYYSPDSQQDLMIHAVVI